MTPFDLADFPALSNGEKISVVRKKELENRFTMGAEFYQPYFIGRVEKIKQKGKFQSLGNLCNLITDGDHSSTQYTNDGVLYLLSESVKEGYLDTNVRRYISSELHNSLRRSKLKPRNVVLTKTGAYFGKSAVIPNDFPEANTSAHVGKFVVIEEIINPYYLSTFFNCDYGYSQLRRRGMKASRPEIKLVEFEDITIFLPYHSFQEKIEQHVQFSINKLTQSEEIFSQAENTLLYELSFANWKPKHEQIFIKHYSHAKQSSRIDAEYYQPKYEEIIQAIQGYSNSWDRLEKLAFVEKCVEVGSNEYLEKGIPFVRVSNLSPFEITEEKYISDELYEELIHHQPRKGEILLSKDATPGIAYYLKEEPKKMIPSGGILRLKLKSDKINHECLTLILNSILTKEQINRDVGGSVILHWRPDQVKETAIPILPQEKQIQIQKKVTESFNLRKQSKHLLECAKRAVEIAIEQDEETALRWLEKESRL